MISSFLSLGTAKNQVPHIAIAAFLVASNAWHVFCAVARWNLEILHVCTCAYFLCHWWFLSLRFEDLWRFDHKPNEITLSTKRLRALPIPSNNDQTRSASLYSSKNSQIQFFLSSPKQHVVSFQLHRPIFKARQVWLCWDFPAKPLNAYHAGFSVGPGRWWIFYPRGFNHSELNWTEFSWPLSKKDPKNGWRKTNRFSTPPTWSWHEMRLAARCIGHGSLLCAAGVVMVWSRWFRDVSAWGQGTDVFEGKPVMQCDMLAVIGSPRPRKTKW